MAEQRVIVEGFFPPTTSGGTSSTSASSLATYEVRAPQVVGAYSFSLADAPGVVAANNFVTVFNPIGSGKIIIGSSAGLSGFVVTGTPTPPLSSIKIFRITTATGGSLQAASAINKFQTSDPNPVAEVRTGNPTATVGAQIFCFPPGVNGTFDASRHQVLPVSGLGGIVCLPGEGFVFRTTSGDTEQQWNIDVSWAEVNP